MRLKSIIQICHIPHKSKTDNNNKKVSYRKQTVRLLHNIEITVLHESHIMVLIGLFQSNRERRLTCTRHNREVDVYRAIASR